MSTTLLPILHNIRSVYNVGAIIRTAEGFGATELLCSGYTPCPARPNLLPHVREKLVRELTKTAVGADKFLKISCSNDIESSLSNLKSQNFLILGLENNIAPKIPIYNLATTVLGPIINDKKVALLLGEEVHGIPPELYPYLDAFLEIPMKGKKESFNVSVAAGIALFALANS